MAREILLSKKTEQGLRLDPRTKLLLIFIISIFVMGGTGGEAMGLIRLVLCTVPAILLLTSKQCAKAVGYIAVFSAFYAVQIYVLPHLTGILNFLVLFTTGFFCRILPSVAIAAYAVKTTTVSELISGMERIHMPKEVTIPLTVMFRFFPTVFQESEAISDAMKMRGIKLGGKKSSKILEYKLIPMITCSVKIGEELSAAAITRGLGAPVKRTNICQGDCFPDNFRRRDFAMIDFQNVSFSYGEESSGGGIRNVNLTINTGEFVLLTGESGCGKTTITRLVNGLVPHYYEGNLEGDVLLDGKSVSDTPLYDLAAMVGSVFQNPKSQFFNVDTDSELAFACENLGYPQEDILKRIDRTVSDYHIEDLMGRSVFALSGGEKQKIACASSSVLLPGIMVLDEPSSNLDMAAIDDLRQVLSLWKKQGKTILIAEHRLYYLHDLADRVLYVKDGEIEREYTPAEFDSLSDGTRKEMGLRPFSLSKLKPANQYQAHTAKLMEFQNFCFAYKKREPESLHIPSAELPVGETIAIIGLNGAGKSTLARCICGLEKKCGLLQVDGKTLDWKARLKHCYMVMQDTSHQLFTESVTDEVLLSMDNKDETVVDKILKQFDLLEYKDRHPLSLSGGQKQRVAIASAIVSNREIIVFDEPTSGLDLKHMREVARSLKSLADQGKTLLVITHDPELVMAGCSYVVHMEKGQIKESYPLDESGSKKVLDFFRIRQ